jgi:hypothetical protein
MEIQTASSPASIEISNLAKAVQDGNRRQASEISRNLSV